MELLDLSIRLDLPTSEGQLLRLAEEAFAVANQAEANYLNLPGTEVHVWVEQGSINYKTKIYVALSALYIGIGNFDGFVGGLQRIIDISRKAVTYISEETIHNNTGQLLNVKGTLGLPEKLNRILKDVKEGKVTIEQGTQKVINLLEKEEGAPNLKQGIVKEFEQAASSITLQEQYDLFPDLPEVVTTTSEKKRRSGSNRPKQEPSLQGVEIWYDRKSGRKEVRHYKVR